MTVHLYYDTRFNFLKYPKGEISQGILQEYFVEEKNRDICIWSKIFQFSRMDPNGIYDITTSIFLAFYDANSNWKRDKKNPFFVSVKLTNCTSF